ncbi:MAG TPA: hypothetical protein PKG95_05760 [Anaerolineaceae bacterium]|jgi:hypothetical protein|nr:hypothetical protein [Anaerolineaceae bacterium]
MNSLPENLTEYKQQMKQGSVPAAYRGLMEYILGLRTYFKNKYPNFAVPGSIYPGYMDMTYFAINPEALQQRGLKIAIVFLHEAFRFEVWLAGSNKQVQAKYWQLFQDNPWGRYHLVATIQGADAILEHILVNDPDFSDLEQLTRQIELETLKFIADVEQFLTSH